MPNCGGERNLYMGTLRDPPHKYRAEHYWLEAYATFVVG
jgi:hypothetical protein